MDRSRDEYVDGGHPDRGLLNGEIAQIDALDQGPGRGGKGSQDHMSHVFWRELLPSGELREIGHGGLDHPGQDIGDPDATPPHFLP